MTPPNGWIPFSLPEKWLCQFSSYLSGCFSLAICWFLLITFLLQAGVFQGLLLRQLLLFCLPFSFSDLIWFQSIACAIHADYQQIPISNWHLFASSVNGSSIIWSHPLLTPYIQHLLIHYVLWNLPSIFQWGTLFLVKSHVVTLLQTTMTEMMFSSSE